MTTSEYAAQRHAVLITGGSEGIGLALARRYLARGDRVMVTGRRAERLRDASARFAGLEVFVSDIGRPDEREALASHVANVMPEIDTVVNNAGVQRRVSLAEDDGPWAAARSEIEILLDGPVHLNHLLIPALIDSGRAALIIDVTSGGAFLAQTFAPIYSAAKAALHSYTMNLRWALAETRIGVTELIPPAIATALTGDGGRHGADVDEFCDLVFPLLDGSRDEVGFGFTDSDQFRDLLDRERQLFELSARRSDVMRYREGMSSR